jgi:hypothetical protein
MQQCRNADLFTAPPKRQDAPNDPTEQNDMARTRSQDGPEHELAM